MAANSNRLVLLRPGRATALDAEALAALPFGAIAAVFEDRSNAVDAAVQLLMDNPDRPVWVRSGQRAADSIRAARAGRNAVVRLLRGFGDEEATVREVLRHATYGRTILIVQGDDKMARRLLDASHLYQFGLWTIRTVR